MTDLKTSLLINRQVPEFVREDHPKFVLFLEAYYEFLDQNGYGKSKQFRDLTDVDASLNEFEQQFYNSFMPFIPRNVPINKEILIKNILPLYLSKGSENSYRFLFRLLFDQEISIESPGRQILRASDGRWSQENIIRVETSVYSEYVADGVNSTYYLPYVMDLGEFDVYVDGVLFEQYQLRKETRKIIFDFVLLEGQVVRINYNDFNASFINNLQVTGQNSGAHAIVERASRTNVGGLNFYQLFVDNRNVFGEFNLAETLTCNFVIDGQTIPIFLKLYSGVLRIDVINGGANYNIGDPVIVRGTSETPAIAQVEDVVSGVIESLSITDSGCGFKVTNEITAETYNTAFFLAEVLSVDDSGLNSPNTITYNTDVISDYLNVSIGAADYGFPAAGTEDANTVIANALTSNVVSNVGPITSTQTNVSQLSSSLNPNFIVESSTLFNNIKISDLGAIGKINIVSAGVDYEVGDQLIFTNTTSFSGQGANAIVSQVDANGAIEKIQFINLGLGYQVDHLPDVTINSANGSNAILEVSGIMGVTAAFSPVIEGGIPGQIKSIKVISQGVGYETIPGIDLTISGDGAATANATLTNSFITLEGRWKTSDSIISDDQIRLQGRDYYIPYSYVISSQVEFDSYKELLKNLLHPAGLINYSKYRIRQTSDVNMINDAESTLIRTVAGTVSVSNGSNTVTGTNTEFTVANTSNIITQNTVIVVNDEIRSIVSIGNATSLTVNTAFTATSNNKIVKILS